MIDFRGICPYNLLLLLFTIVEFGFEVGFLIFTFIKVFDNLFICKSATTYILLILMHFLIAFDLSLLLLISNKVISICLIWNLFTIGFVFLLRPLTFVLVLLLEAYSVDLFHFLCQ